MPVKTVKKAIPKEVVKEVISIKTSLIIIIAVTFLAFLPTFNNGYLFWDDTEYIIHNPMLMAPLKVMFGIPSGYYMWNYHPLTILIYSIEYKFFGTTMAGYHTISLLFHIANSILVFYFIYFLLSKKNILIAFITSILFAIHPMHVESVAWASELKDVLYTFFFLAALICYVFYVQKGKQLKHLVYALVFYLLSIISKGQAVTLPVSLLLIDYFLRRKLALNMLMDKIVFFALSVIFGLIAIKAQDNSIVFHSNSVDFQNLFFGFYALTLYIYKFFLPINLSGLYPYPNPENTHNTVPIMVYAAPVVVLVLLLIIFRFFRRDRYVMFGVLFFIGNIFTVLKFIPVSEAIIADRYSYIPYIGLFFAVGYGFNKLLNNPQYKTQKNVIQYSGIGLLLVLSTLTFARTMVWKDSFSFWTDVIKGDPSYWHSYECLGEASLDKGDYPAAIMYFRESVEKDRANQSNNSSRLNLALCYYRKGIYDSALQVCKAIIAIDPNMAKAYDQRGLIYQFASQPQPQLALADYNKAIELNPDYAEAYVSRGSLYVDHLGKYDLGIADFNKALELNPNNIDAFTNKGIAFYKEGNFDEALNIFNQVVGRVQDNGRIYFLQALAYAGKKDYSKALELAAQAQSAGAKIDAALLQEWKEGKG